MKKNVIVFWITLLVTNTSYAQEFRKFKVGFGLSMASGQGSSGGILLTFEPAYRIKDNLSIGLRLDSALVTRGFSKTLSAASKLEKCIFEF